MATRQLLGNQPQTNVIVVQQATQVYGVSIPNEKAARLTREIMRLSLALALIQLGFVFYNSIALDQNYFFVQGFLVWLLPFCGYFGAKYRNRAMIVAYSMLNCILAVFLPIAIVGIMVVLHYITDSLPSLCPDGASGFPHWDNMNSTVYANGHPVTCADLYDITSETRLVYAITLPLGVVSTIIACRGCSSGFKLANTRYFVTPMTQFTTGTVSTVSRPVQAYVTAQPVQAYATNQAKMVPPISTV